jgi:hypothetical protein
LPPKRLLELCDDDGLQSHGRELAAAAQQILLRVDSFPVLAPARPRRARRYASGVHRHARRRHGPPFGFGHGLVADDEQPDAGAPTPIVVRHAKPPIAKLPLKQIT